LLIAGVLADEIVDLVRQLLVLVLCGGFHTARFYLR
jgi:hypothetical protein